MKRTLSALLLLIVAALSACQPGQVRQPTQSSDIARALDATIIMYDNFDTRLLCAGQRVSPTLILTAHHCVVSATTPPDIYEILEMMDPSLDILNKTDYVGRTIRYSTYADTLKAGRKGAVQIHRAKVLRTDAAHDVALLETPASSQPFVPFRKRDLRVGEPVFSIGHPTGLKFTFARGWVSTTCRYDVAEDVCFTQVDITIWGGSSGGGLYDEDGFLVGVASAMTIRPPGAIAFFVHIDAVDKLLNP